MNQLQVFRNNEFGQIRTLTIDNEPWFVGKDVADALGYSNTRDALSKHVDDEDKGVANCDTLGGTQEMVIINESGLYSLIMSSKLPSAKKFKRWVTSEVLPSIRKTGSYLINNNHELTQEDWMRILEIMSQMPKDRIQYALIILNKIAPGEFNSVQDVTDYNRNNSLYDFLKSIPVIGIPTNQIYQKYCNWCQDNNFEPISNIEFSKQAKRLLNIDIISKRIDKQTRRVFTTK